MALRITEVEMGRLVEDCDSPHWATRHKAFQSLRLVFQELGKRAAEQREVEREAERGAERGAGEDTERGTLDKGLPGKHTNQLWIHGTSVEVLATVHMVHSRERHPKVQSAAMVSLEAFCVARSGAITAHLETLLPDVFLKLDDRHKHVQSAAKVYCCCCCCCCLPGALVCLCTCLPHICPTCCGSHTRWRFAHMPRVQGFKGLSG